MINHISIIHLNNFGFLGSKSVLEKIEKVNCKANAKAIWTFDFSILFTKAPHNINDFVFKRNNTKYIVFSGNTAF